MPYFASSLLSEYPEGSNRGRHEFLLTDKEEKRGVKDSPKEVFVYSIKVVLKFFVSVGSIGVVCRVMIYVREEDGLREWWLDMFSRATIAVTTCPDLFRRG